MSGRHTLPPAPVLEHPLCGCDPMTLLSVLSRHGGADRGHRARLAAILGLVALRAPFSLAEAVWFGWRRRRLPPMQPPVFIVGHWRSGTTHLYNVMSRDRRFGFVPPLAVGLPWDMFGIGGALGPVLDRALPESRHIDNVPVTPDSPQEDEIALANMSPLSFYHGLYFPRRFAEAFERGIFLEGCTAEELAGWRRRFLYFLEKLTLRQGGRRLLIKNPVYSARVALLRGIWPDARFIHIHRDPRAVFVSTVGFYRTLFARLSLQDYGHIDIERLVLDSYPRIMQALVDQTADLPPGQLAEVAFEDFERDPLPELERVYRTLDLPGYAEALPDFERYLSGVRGYAKNPHRLADDARRRVERAWEPFIARWGATSEGTAARPAR